MKLKATTFKFLCRRNTVEVASFILVDIYRPGSVQPSSAFCNEFTGLLKMHATFQLPVAITGDLIIHLQKRDDVDAVRLVDFVSSCDMLQHVSSPTHDRGGLLDVIIASGDHAYEGVCVGLSDACVVIYKPVAAPSNLH